MPAKILAFDPNRRVPARHYTPIEMRGRLLVMPARSEAAPADENRPCETASMAAESAVQERRKPFCVISNPRSESSLLR